MRTENITPFLAHDYLLRRWFDLVSLAEPLVGKDLKERLESEHLNMVLVAPGLIADVRRGSANGQVIVEDEREVTKGIINRRTFKLPARLVFRAPHFQITLYAPSVTPHGKLRAGTLTVEVYANKMPHESGEGITATFHYRSVGESYEAQRPKLSVSKTVDAIDTDDLSALIRLQPLIEALEAREPLRLLLKHILEQNTKCYALNDQWSADMRRLATLLNVPIPISNAAWT